MGGELMRSPTPGPSRLTAAAAVAAGAITFAVSAAALGAFGGPVTVAGLTAPRGLTPLDHGRLLIAEVGAGRILEMGPGGDLSVVHDGLPFTLISGPGGRYPAGPSAVVLRGGDYFYVVGEHTLRGFSELYRLSPGGSPEAVTGQEIVDRFPTNPLTNPYDLVAAPGGGFLISDSGTNTLLHVSEDGEISECVSFPRRENPVPLNGFTEIDVVPTGMAYGPDGALYVASLTGYPYPEGAAYVYRIETAVGDGATCGQAMVHAEGFTAATDLAFDEDGSMLVVEFSSDMRALAEDDIREAHRIPGRLVRWRDGEVTVVREGLVSPTAVVVADGRVFVSEEFAGRVSEIAVGEAGIGGWAWAGASLAGALVATLALLVPARLSGGAQGAVRLSRGRGDRGGPAPPRQ